MCDFNKFGFMVMNKEGFDLNKSFFDEVVYVHMYECIIILQHMKYEK